MIGYIIHTVSQFRFMALVVDIMHGGGPNLRNALPVTIHGKCFEGENFRGFRSFSANCKSFPLKLLAMYSI